MQGDAFADGSSARAPVPERIGRFVITGRLGEGGMGVVYSGYDGELGRPVALKLMHGALDADDGARPGLLREAQALARLSHPNVVQTGAVSSSRSSTRHSRVVPASVWPRSTVHLAPPLMIRAACIGLNRPSAMHLQHAGKLLVEEPPATSEFERGERPEASLRSREGDSVRWCRSRASNMVRKAVPCPLRQPYIAPS